MGPEKRKGELKTDEPAEKERSVRREEEGQDVRREAIDRREDEGFGQPESSAQKTPRRPEDEELGE